MRSFECSTSTITRPSGIELAHNPKNPVIITTTASLRWKNNNTIRWDQKDLSTMSDPCLIRIIGNASDVFQNILGMQRRLQAPGLLHLNSHRLGLGSLFRLTSVIGFTVICSGCWAIHKEGADIAAGRPHWAANRRGARQYDALA